MSMSFDLPRIIKELNLDVPIYRVQAHDDCVALHLYGGKVVTWNPNLNDWCPVTCDQVTKNQAALEQTCKNRNSRKRREEQ